MTKPKLEKIGVASDFWPAVLTQRLADRIRENDPKAKPKPESERWLKDMELLVRDRGGDHEEVRQMIDWSQAHPFWRSNILSPGKLRKQFTQLVLQAQQPQRGSTTSELVRKLV